MCYLSKNLQRFLTLLQWSALSNATSSSSSPSSYYYYYYYLFSLSLSLVTALRTLTLLIVVVTMVDRHWLLQFEDNNDFALDCCDFDQLFIWVVVDSRVTKIGLILDVSFPDLWIIAVVVELMLRWWWLVDFRW